MPVRVSSLTLDPRVNLALKSPSLFAAVSGLNRVHHAFEGRLRLYLTSIYELQALQSPALASHSVWAVPEQLLLAP